MLVTGKLFQPRLTNPGLLRKLVNYGQKRFITLGSGCQDSPHHGTQYNDTRHNDTHLNSDTQDIIYLRHPLRRYTECHYDKCLYAECRGAHH